MFFIVHLVFTFLLTMNFSDGVLYTVEDVSKPTVCQKGLWYNDLTELNIRVDMESDEVTDATSFLMELEDPLQKVARKACLIFYKAECNMKFNVTEGCFCKHEAVRGKIYNIKYLSRSKVAYSKNIVWINGRRHSELKMPSVGTDDVTAIFRVNSGQRIPTTSTGCIVLLHLDQNSDVTIQFCPQGLNYPTLKEGDKNVTDDCLSVTKTLSQSETSLTFDYQDQCQRSGTYQCTLQTLGATPPSGPEGAGTVGPVVTSLGPGATTNRMDKTAPPTSKFVRLDLNGVLPIITLTRLFLIFY